MNWNLLKYTEISSILIPSRLSTGGLHGRLLSVPLSYDLVYGNSLDISIERPKYFIQQYPYGQVRVNPVSFT